MVAEETGKHAEVAAVVTSNVTSNLEHRQCVSTIDLCARRTTHRTLGLYTSTHPQTDGTSDPSLHVQPPHQTSRSTVAEKPCDASCH